jgi:hypothetical protein
MSLEESSRSWKTLLGVMAACPVLPKAVTTPAARNALRPVILSHCIIEFS